MKKSLLFIIVLLAMASTSMAQDIWFSIYKNDEAAHYYRNGELVLSISESSPRDILALDGHIYFAYMNYMYDKGIVYDYTAGTTYLETETSNIGAIFPGENGLDVYTVGNKEIESEYRAALWRGSTLQILENGGGSYSFGSCGCVADNGDVYVGGYQLITSPGSGVYQGLVWHNGTILYTMPMSSRIDDMTFYDGNIYSVVNQASGYCVYKNDEIIFSNGSEFNCIFIDGGDIYVGGYEDSHPKVWKNGEVLYDVSQTRFRVSDLWVNSNDVYFKGYSDWDKSVKVWKNGEELYSFNNNCNTSLGGLCVEPLECENTASRPLPFFEGFESGETDWECWTNIDMDGDNDGRASYWDRGGRCGDLNTKLPHTGDHVAIHRDCAYGFPQEGWLISPRLALQSNCEVTLSFYSCNEYPSSYDFGYEGVWVSIDIDPNNLYFYTELWHPSSVMPSWEEVTVDLSDYAGQNVYIAFVYLGNEAHEWLIDDISVTESVWTPCDPVTDFPFEEHFDTDPFGIGSCWYPLDIDVNNVVYDTYWKWNSDDECVWHQIGPVEQEGWLFSPSLQLESGRDYTLSFNSLVVYPTNYEESSVWIALDKTGVPNPSDYTKIWEETNPVEEWVERRIDLSAYAGHTVNIAFKYGGTLAHIWKVDDFVVAEGIINGINENDHAILGLYPNPAKETICLDGVSADNVVEIYNSLGMKVKATSLGTNREIHIDKLPSGLYLIRCGNKAASFIKE